MPIPDFPSLMLPLVEFAADGTDHATSAAANYLANKFGLTEQEKKKLLPVRKQTVFNHKLQWARACLSMAGLLENRGRGYFRVTPRGQQVLAGNPPVIDIPFLRQFPEYLEAINERGRDTPITHHLNLMPTYLLTWKPSRAPWSEGEIAIDDSIRELHAKGFCDFVWSCGRNRRIEKGDRVFLLRQGSDRPGIIASGRALCEPYEGDHWDKTRPGEKSPYIRVRGDSLLNAETTAILRREDLDFGSSNHWNTQASGISLPQPVAVELERRWSAHLAQLGLEPVLLPDEVSIPDSLFEGATRQVTVSIWERNPHARRTCIEHYGVRCSVCDFDFEAVYGERGRGFIHVHHLKPGSEIRAEYEIDPIADLRPICPNCHAMIHRTPEIITIEALRNLLTKTGWRWDAGFSR